MRFLQSDRGDSGQGRTDRPTMSRRRALKLGGLGAVAATGIAGLGTGLDAAADTTRAASGGKPGAGRIDVHHHVLTPAMRQWAIDNGLLPPQGGPRWASWTLASTLETMEANGIAAGVASAPVPAEAFRDRTLAASGVRLINESAAELVRDHPTRFGFFAYLSLHHVELALEQAAYALDELNAEGVILMITAGDRYLGHQDFDPVFAELNRRRAVVFTHPDALPDGATELPDLDESAIDYPFGTTRAALSLITSGTLQRYPDVSIILSHAGGFLPYVAQRVKLQGERGEGPDPAAVEAGLRRFYYDTALPASPYATPTLLAAVDRGHVLYGSDWPARPADQISTITTDLDRDPALDERTRQRINRGNALRLLPRLAKRLGD